MVRKWISALAQQFPPTDVSERITTWLTVVLGVAGVAWGLITYTNDVGVKRVTASLDFFQGYLSRFSPLSENYGPFETLGDQAADLTLRTRCNYILRSVASGEIEKRHSAELDCVESELDFIATELSPYDLTGQSRCDLRTEVETALFPLVDRNILVDTAIDYLASVVVCVDAGNCDSDTAGRMFHTAMTNAVNLTCVPDSDLQPGSRRYSIVDFLLDQRALEMTRSEDSADGNRQSLFLCRDARALEADRTGVPAPC
jgi:hypothetical protein